MHLSFFLFFKEAQTLQDKSKAQGGKHKNYFFLIENGKHSSKYTS